MTATTATTDDAAAGPASVPMTPKEFVRRLRRLVKTGSPWDVAAFYDQHGADVAPLLRGRDRVLVADVMHVVDAATDWRPSPEMLRPPGSGPGRLTGADEATQPRGTAEVNGDREGNGTSGAGRGNHREEVVAGRAVR